MDIVYLTNSRIPTEKAHGVAVMKTCEAFARAGHAVTLIVPRRRTTTAKTAHAYYGLPDSFNIIHLPTIDLVRTGPLVRFAYLLQACTFYCVAFGWTLIRRPSVVYTTDVQVACLEWFGLRVIYECHVAPRASKMFFFLARRAERVIAISREIKERFRAHGVDTERILVAGNAVDLDVFDVDVSKEEARAATEIPSDAFVALYTGKFTTLGMEKGIAECIAALTRLPDDTLFMAVGGDDADIARYRALAEKFNIDRRAVFVGHVAQMQLAIYQKAADVLLMPFPDIPHYRSTMSPMKMFEYMASKRPIIASDLPTIREILDDTTACFVPPGDPDAIAHAVAAVRAKPQEARSRAEAAYRSAAAHTWDRRAAAILQFIVAGRTDTRSGAPGGLTTGA